MPIWIRGQNKQNLVECQSIEVITNRIGEHEVIANYKCIESDELYDILGVYSSKEKAIKVLDIIQEKIIADKGNILRAIYKEQNANAEENMIFKMPQDIIIIDDNEVEV